MIGLRNIEPGRGTLGAGVQGVVGWVLVAGDWLAGDDGATGLVADGKVDGQPGAGKAGGDGVLDGARQLLSACWNSLSSESPVAQGRCDCASLLGASWLLCLCLECGQVKHLCLHSMNDPVFLVYEANNAKPLE